ncbi:hypothetical protein DMUE_3062 [Dictyocoela muelleri]|nr:hypothetical protein DMUE_3062 [Dictyocoela muelleri]
MNAMKRVFKNIKIYNCLFHFAQIIWRHVQRLGIVSKYKKYPDFRFKIKMLLAISFVPNNCRNDYFSKFKIFIKEENDNDLNKLIDYFEKSFINNNRNEISEWGCYYRILNNIPLTTNVCEGFNRALNSLISGSHPSLIKFIILLRTQDHIQDKKISVCIILRDRSHENKQYQNKYNKLKDICSNYEEYYKLFFIREIAMVYEFGI